MTQWAAFAGLTLVVLLLLLVLSYLTQQAFEESSPAESQPQATSERDLESTAETPLEHRDNDDGDGDELELERESRIPLETETETKTKTRTEAETVQPQQLSTGALLANVAISQGLFAGVLIGAAVYFAIPPEALGIHFEQSYLYTGLVLGTIIGVGLYISNEIGAASAKRFGIDHDEELRELLAPDTLGGWLVLLFVVLPIIAVFEELLFRAALIGVFAAGFGISPWLLAVLSSIAFALGHGVQGTAGILVTGTLGFVLAAVFILTGSFLIVVVAHYLINALEFIVHEGLGLEWADTETDTDAETKTTEH